MLSIYSYNFLLTVLKHLISKILTLNYYMCNFIVNISKNIRRKKKCVGRFIWPNGPSASAVSHPLRIGRGWLVMFSLCAAPSQKERWSRRGNWRNGHAFIDRDNGTTEEASTAAQEVVNQWQQTQAAGGYRPTFLALFSDEKCDVHQFESDVKAFKVDGYPIQIKCSRCWCPVQISGLQRWFWVKLNFV